MSVRRRGNRWLVEEYDPSTRRKRHVAVRDSREEAIALDGAMKLKRAFDRTPRRGWTLESKDEPDCRACGREATNLHHIVPLAAAPAGADANDPTFNGMPLCQGCHIGWHRNAVRIPYTALRPEEIGFVAGAIGLDWLDANYPGGGPLDVDQLLMDEIRALRAVVAELQRQLANEGDRG